MCAHMCLSILQALLSWMTSSEHEVLNGLLPGSDQGLPGHMFAIQPPHSDYLKPPAV